ncbi:ABC transporter ATP-binding protein [Treponema pectinovorum]
MYFKAMNLKKEWNDFTLDASLECEKSTMTTILGASGSGKSTLLRIIAGLEKCDGAKLFLDKKDISSVKIRERGIGMVFQSPSLFAHLTVEDNVAYGLVCQGIKKKDARLQANEFLKKFNLDGFSKRSPETLSGGEAQRVSLARTLIVKPRLVLFDEPLSALDAPLRKKLAQEIRTLQKEIGFTGIMVTHDIAEAKQVSDKIILLKSGKIVWQGLAKDFSEELMQ